jgi:hypothetical protein
MHPSQTNYIAAVAGELCGVTEDDSPPALLEQRTIVDLLEEAPEHLRWKGYMESFDPAANRWSLTLKPADACPYYVKHNPFASFKRIVRDRRRWERIDSEAGFFADVLNDDLPEFAWFTPNIWSDRATSRSTTRHVRANPPGGPLIWRPRRICSSPRLQGTCPCSSAASRSLQPLRIRARCAQVDPFVARDDHHAACSAKNAWTWRHVV